MADKYFHHYDEVNINRRAILEELTEVHDTVGRGAHRYEPVDLDNLLDGGIVQDIRN